MLPCSALSAPPSCVRAVELARKSLMEACAPHHMPTVRLGGGVGIHVTLGRRHFAVTQTTRRLPPHVLEFAVLIMAASSGLPFKHTLELSPRRRWESIIAMPSRIFSTSFATVRRKSATSGQTGLTPGKLAAFILGASVAHPTASCRLSQDCSKHGALAFIKDRLLELLDCSLEPQALASVHKSGLGSSCEWLHCLVSKHKDKARPDEPAGSALSPLKQALRYLRILRTQDSYGVFIAIVLCETMY